MNLLHEPAVEQKHAHEQNDEHAQPDEQTDAPVLELEGDHVEQDVEGSDHDSDPAAVDRFAEFWTQYPRREGKKRALAQWRRQRLDAKADLILDDVGRRFVHADPQFIPHASTYLQQERWQDDMPPPPVAKTAAALAALEATATRVERLPLADRALLEMERQYAARDARATDGRPLTSFELAEQVYAARGARAVWPAEHLQRSASRIAELKEKTPRDDDDIVTEVL